MCDPNEITRNYLNNGSLREQDSLDERDLHAGDIVIEFPNPDYTKEFFLAGKNKVK